MRLPKVLLVTGVTIIVVVALLVSGLRVVLPQINAYRTQLLAKIQSITDIPIEIGYMDGRWEVSGPTFELRDINLKLPQADWQVKRITLALNVWQSLLHRRWQFEDMTFYQLQLDLHIPVVEEDNKASFLTSGKAGDIFLRQLDYFDLRDSRISFLTPSGTRAELQIPQLTWLNTRTRHRAEGQIKLMTVDGQYGVVEARVDLDDGQGTLSNGMIYLQADNIDVKPWISRLLHENTGLGSVKFSLNSWLTVKHGLISDVSLLFKEGQADWQIAKKQHQLAVNNLVIQIQREGDGWQLNVPELNLATDHHIWPKGSLSALWLPASDSFIGDKQKELRIRATQLQLERLGPLLPVLSFLSDDTITPWLALQPQGRLETLALDIPLKQPEKTRFQAKWQNISWQPWKLLPGINHFAGNFAGTIDRGRVMLDLNNSTLPYGDMFRVPLAVASASGSLQWHNNEKGWELWSDNLDIQANALWINGDFRYQQPVQGPPWLNILAGIRLYDAGAAWRYFPQPLMGAALVDYLSEAIKGGQVDNASLIYNGNPHEFPYKQNEGQFEVYVPLRNATFQFQPDWPALTALEIDLDFANEGLWMSAAKTLLGKAKGSNIKAVIPDYLKEKLFIDAEVVGEGRVIQDYFMRTPLQGSVGAALDELQVSGDVSGRLHLDIPLSQSGITRASGEVSLHDNGVFIKPLASRMDKVSGKFRFDNGNLRSGPLSASWLGQLLTINFTTEEQRKNYRVDIDLQGNWLVKKLPGIPILLAKMLTGDTHWEGKVAIQLPSTGKTNYQVNVNTDIKEVSSYLPVPLDKKSGQVLPVKVQATGDLRGFTLTGSVGENNHFNSQWVLENQQAALARGVWQTDSKKIPILPEGKQLVLSVPSLDGDSWSVLLASAVQSKDSNFSWLDRLVLQTPSLSYGGQSWQNLLLLIEKKSNSMLLTAKGNQIDGSLVIQPTVPWRADIRYFYYNPDWDTEDSSVAGKQAPQSVNSNVLSFKGWPALILRCQECWIMGQNLKRLEADLTPQEHSLLLENGLIDVGIARLAASGQWQLNAKGEHTVLKGKISGSKFDQSTDFFGITTPLKGSPFDVNFNLDWYGAPWKPRISMLNGILNAHLGKGHLDNLGGGHAGQLLRLVSFDALLRKLQLDFSDTFSKDFSYDSIRGTASIKDGILHTKDLLIDGLSADIAMNGYVNLVERQINMEAVIAPEISATVGVATAFVINPLVGAAVFAATKVLAPLWNKVSLLRYRITGSLDKPQIHEVLRQLKKDEQ